MPSPVEIEPPRIGVDLHGNAMLRAGRKYLLDIYLVARPPKKLTSRHMPEDRDKPILHRANDAIGLLLPVLPELAMDARHDEVELAQHVVWIVERTVRKNVGLCALKDPEFAAV